MGKAEAIKWSKCRSFMASYAFDRVVKVGQRADGFRELVAELKKKGKAIEEHDTRGTE